MPCSSGVPSPSESAFDTPELQGLVAVTEATLEPVSLFTQLIEPLSPARVTLRVISYVPA